ncbi:MAG: hypothetical protein WC222_05985 [Parachlamydiales bacterium]|jgi:hypothetical protein
MTHTTQEIHTLHRNSAVYQEFSANEKNNIPSRLGVWNGRDLYLFRKEGTGILDSIWVRIQNFVASVLEFFNWMTFDDENIKGLRSDMRSYFIAIYCQDIDTKHAELTAADEQLKQLTEAFKEANLKLQALRPNPLEEAHT